MRQLDAVSVCDWLVSSLIDHRLSHFTSRVASPQILRLMPFAFYR